MTIAVECNACQTRFRAGKEHAGRKGKCPKCGGPILIPAAAATVTPAKPAAPSAVTATPLRQVPMAQPLANPMPPNSSLMADLLDEAAGEPLPPARCADCGNVLPAGTVICVNCGYNLRTGQKMQTVVEQPPEESKEAEEPTASDGFAGSFLLGCVASFFGALLGMGIWVAVLVATNYEFDFDLIFWGVGALAGAGMQVGYRRHGDLAGTTAAMIALVVILGTEFALLKVLIARGFFADELAEGTSISILFATTMIGVWGYLFLLLGFVTAYKFGAGRSNS